MDRSGLMSIFMVCVLYTLVFRGRDPSVLAALRRMVRMLINIIAFGAVCVCLWDDIGGRQNARNVYKHTLLKGSSMATEVYKCIIYNIKYIVDHDVCIVIIMYTRWFKTIFLFLFVQENRSFIWKLYVLPTHEYNMTVWHETRTNESSIQYVV